MFRNFRGPLFHEAVTGQELYFAVSYSKPALAKYLNNFVPQNLNSITILTLMYVSVVRDQKCHVNQPEIPSNKGGGRLTSQLLSCILIYFSL